MRVTQLMNALLLLLKKSITIFKKHFTFFILVCFSILLSLLSYQSGSYLTGWDDLHSEFNLLEHFNRSIFSLWQEHHGTGDLIGSGYAGDLPRLVYIWILSWFMPVNIIRYFFHFSMLFIGTIGVYFVIKQFFADKNEKIQNTVSLFGSLFYLLNLGTMQYFATPFEPFSMFWGMFPWLIFSTLRFLHDSSRKNLIIFLLIHLLSTPMVYVFTIFYVYTLVFIILLISHVIQKKSKNSITTSLTALILFLIINSFWLLPHTYWVINGRSVQQNAMLNRLVTDETYQRSQQFGNLSDFALLKNKPWDYKDFSGQSEQFIMQPWHDHFNNPAIPVVGYIFFIVVLLGIFTAKSNRLFVIGLFTMSFLILANQTPIAKEFNFLFRKIDIINQVFRDPFTKFIVPAIFVFAVGFSGGLVFLYGVMKRLSPPVMSRIILIFGSSGVGLLLFIYMLPAYSGHLIADRMKIKIPDYYFEFFDYMKNQDSTKRVADLPQGPIWGWMSYNWGYTGSGFLWHGFSQSLLNRTFDVWNEKNEEYFWEINYALSKKDYNLFNSILQKYEISYLMFDSSLYFPDNPRSAFDISRQKEFIEKNPDLKKIKSFGTIDVYETNINNNKYISVIHDAPTISTNTNWLQNDIAYDHYGDYIVGSDTNSQVFYPFRSLFSGRGSSDIKYKIKSTENEFIFNANIPNGKILFPQNVEEESIQFDSNSLKPVVKIPKISNNGKNIQIASVSAVDNGELEIIIDKDNLLGSFDSNTEESSTLKNSSVFLPQLPHKNGYLIAVKSKNIKGAPFRFWVENLTAKRSDQLTYLSKQEFIDFEYFILPPMASDGIGYTLHFENLQVGKSKPENELIQVVVYPIPYKFLTEMKIVTEENPQISSRSDNIVLNVNHPSSHKYIVSLEPKKIIADNSTIMLSQSYDPGWNAYIVDGWLSKTFPMIFGKKIDKHVMINNWANGWEIDNLISRESKVENHQVEIAIVFLPQYLQFFGFLLLPIPFIYAFWTRKKRQVENT